MVASRRMVAARGFSTRTKARDANEDHRKIEQIFAQMKHNLFRSTKSTNSIFEGTLYFPKSSTRIPGMRMNGTAARFLSSAHRLRSLLMPRAGIPPLHHRPTAVRSDNATRCALSSDAAPGHRPALAPLCYLSAPAQPPLRRAQVPPARFGDIRPVAMHHWLPRIQLLCLTKQFSGFCKTSKK